MRVRSAVRRGMKSESESFTEGQGDRVQGTNGRKKVFGAYCYGTEPRNEDEGTRSKNHPAVEEEQQREKLQAARDSHRANGRERKAHGLFLHSGITRAECLLLFEGRFLSLQRFPDSERW